MEKPKTKYDPYNPALNECCKLLRHPEPQWKRFGDGPLDFVHRDHVTVTCPTCGTVVFIHR